MNSQNEKLTIDSPEIAAFLTAWHENGRMFAIVPSRYDTDQRKSASDRRKYIALDCGTSGVFLVDKVTREIWPVKAYGVPNRRKYLGTLADQTAQFSGAQLSASAQNAYDPKIFDQMGF